MKKAAWLTLFAMALALTACVAAGPKTAPPAPRTEVRPAKPGPGYVWIPGHWKWAGGRYLWLKGHWEKTRPGQAWVPGHWERKGRSWVYIPGHWRR
jgi:hypothetical protein